MPGKMPPLRWQSCLSLIILCAAAGCGGTSGPDGSDGSGIDAEELSAPDGLDGGDPGGGDEPAPQDGSDGADSVADGGDEVVAQDGADGGDLGGDEPAADDGDHVEPPSCGALDELEPNDDAQDATPLFSGSEPVVTTTGVFRGEIRTGPDVDFFLFYVDTPGLVMRFSVDVGASGMDAFFAVFGPVGDTALTRRGSNPVGQNVSRQVFFTRAGIYYLEIRDRRAFDGQPPEVPPGTFCYTLTLAVEQPSDPLVRIDLPAGGSTVQDFEVTESGNIGVLRINTADDEPSGGTNVLLPLVFNLAAQPATQPGGPGGSARQPDVDASLIVWDPLLRRVVAAGEDVAPNNTNANTVATLLSDAPRDYWAVIDHFQLQNEDVDAGGTAAGLESRLTLTVSEPIHVSALPFSSTDHPLSPERQAQWYLVEKVPPWLLGALADWTPTDLKYIQIGMQDIGGEVLGLGEPGPTSSVVRLAVRSDRTLVLVRAEDDLVRTVRTAQFSLSIDEPTACPAAVGAQVPSAGDIAFNEVLYDPPDAGGDANGDGFRSVRDDEFIEMVNVTGKLLDLGGVSISDIAAPAGTRHIFPCGTLLSPGEPLLLFSGGCPTGRFGDARVDTVNMTLSCHNSPRALCTANSTVEGFNLEGASGLGIAFIRFNAAGGFTPPLDEPNQAYVRCTSSEGTSCDAGAVYLRHGAVPAAEGRLFSPGARVDGADFSFGQSCQGAYPVAQPTSLHVDSNANRPNLFDGYVNQSGGSCTGFLSAGGERIYAATIPAFKTMTAVVTPADTSLSGPDLALYLVEAPASNCDARPPVCLDGRDDGDQGESETLQYSAGASDMAVFVIVDCYHPTAAGAFSLSISLSG